MTCTKSVACFAMCGTVLLAALAIRGVDRAHAGAEPAVGRAPAVAGLPTRSGPGAPPYAGPADSVAAAHRIAWLAGRERDGQLRGFDFPLRRVACAA